MFVYAYIRIYRYKYLSGSSFFVRAVRFLLTWCQHLYGCFSSMHNVLGQHCFAQRIHQGLELHAGLPYPLSQFERGMAKPARPQILSCRYSGRGSENLATITCASSPAVGMPLSITWAGTGAWVSVSHWRQAHLPRTCSSTVNTPGV